MVVRLGWSMRLPIDPRRYRWAASDIERRYGPHPSDASRDVSLYSGGEFGGVAGITSIYRRPMSVRKEDAYASIGATPDGHRPPPRGHPLIDVSAFFESLPKAMWPWLPALAIACLVGLIGTTIAVAVALT